MVINMRNLTIEDQLLKLKGLLGDSYSNFTNEELLNILNIINRPIELAQAPEEDERPWHLHLVHARMRETTLKYPPMVVLPEPDKDYNFD